MLDDNELLDEYVVGLTLVALEFKLSLAVAGLIVESLFAFGLVSGTGTVTLVEKRGPSEPGVIVTGRAVVIVVTYPLLEVVTTAEMVVVYREATVVVMNSV